MNIPMKSANALEMLTIIEYPASIASDCWPRLAGGWMSNPGPRSARELALAVGERRARLHRQIDAIERAAAPEHLLRGVDVHDREVAAEGAGQSRRLHDAANGERLLAVGGAERQPAAESRCRFLSANSFDRDQGIRLREEHQRIVDGRVLAALEIVVAQAAVAGHVDAEHEQVALPCRGSSRRPLRSPARRRARSTPTAPRSSTSSPKPVSPAVTCSSVLPAMRSMVCENAKSTL